MERLVVVGGDAAGMSAASQARRRRPPEDLEILVLERSGWISYSACGEPYHVAGMVALDDLVVRSPEDFEERGIEVRLRHEAVSIDLDGRSVEVRLPGGGTRREGFDLLMLATGARADRPPIRGVGLPNVHELRTLDDAARLRRAAEAGPGRVVVVGGGYVGLETAEAFLRQGWQTTVLTSGRSVMERSLDPDLGDLVVEGMSRAGIEIVTGTYVECINGTERAESVGCDTGDHPADLVVLALGTLPEVEPAASAGVPLGPTGAIAVDPSQRTGVEGVFAAGDCAEARHRVSGLPVNVHLGTVANKTGRVAGMVIGGEEAEFPGVLGTAITKVCDLEIATTGLRVEEAARAGIEAVTGSVSGTTSAAYWPEASRMSIRAAAERGSGMLLGGQVVGGPGAGKRVDVLATAVWNGMTAEDLSWVDLAYAPPFSGVWDLLHIAGRAAAREAAVTSG